MGIDFCNETERIKLTQLFDTRRDMDIKPLYIYLCPVIMFVCFCGVIFNVMLMSISRQSKVVNKSPILLLSLNLALTDVVASFLNGLNILINSYLREVHDIVVGICTLLTFEVVRCTALVASALHLLALAVVHYRGTVDPLHYRSKIFFSQHLSRTINIISICCWIIPLTIILAWFSSSPCQGFQSNDCDYLFIMGFEYRHMVLTLFALPLILMSAIYLRIFIIISRHQKGRRLNHEQSTLTRGVMRATQIPAGTAAAVNLPELLIAQATDSHEGVIRCAVCAAKALLDEDPSLSMQSEELEGTSGVHSDALHDIKASSFVDNNIGNPRLIERSTKQELNNDDYGCDSRKNESETDEPLKKSVDEKASAVCFDQSNAVIQKRGFLFFTRPIMKSNRKSKLIEKASTSVLTNPNCTTTSTSETTQESEPAIQLTRPDQELREIEAPTVLLKQGVSQIQRCTCDGRFMSNHDGKSKLSRSNTIGSANTKGNSSQENQVVVKRRDFPTRSHGTISSMSQRSTISSSAVAPQPTSSQTSASFKSSLHKFSKTTSKSRPVTAAATRHGVRAAISSNSNATLSSSSYEPQRRHIHASAVPQTNTKALVTTLLILGTYFISYAPAIIFQVLTCVDNCPYPLYTLSFSRRVLLGSMTTLLLIAKSIVDPFIYSCRMSEIQVAVNRYLSKRRSKSSMATSLYTSQRLNKSFNNNNSNYNNNNNNNNSNYHTIHDHKYVETQENNSIDILNTSTKKIDHSHQNLSNTTYEKDDTNQKSTRTNTHSQEIIALVAD